VPAEQRLLRAQRSTATHLMCACARRGQSTCSWHTEQSTGPVRCTTGQPRGPTSQTHKFIQALKLNTSHSGVGYYAPAARTTLNTCVFLCSSRFHLAGKTLRSLLILEFRTGAFRHPAGEFPLRQVFIYETMHP
jgi:hypothetical protein